MGSASRVSGPLADRPAAPCSLLMNREQRDRRREFVEPLAERPADPCSLPVSARRKGRQRGVEAIEFGLWMFLMMPAFLWMFITGMNLIRYIKASDVTRASAMLYTKGQDMTDIGMQQVVARVANGLDLEVTTSGASGNSVGNGLLIFSRVEYVGASCSCNNAAQYVVTQRIYVGNRSLQLSGAGVESFAGPAPSTGWNVTTGLVANATTSNTTAIVNSAFSSLWGSALSDGQYIYMVESFFKPTTTMGSGPFDSAGVYNRIFM